MKNYCVVFLVLSQFAVAAPLVFSDRSSGNEERQSLSLPILGKETFESYVINRPYDWAYRVTLPWKIQGGMTIGDGGEAEVFDEDKSDLGENSTPGGKQHFQVQSGVVIYFPHKVQAFGFVYSGYDGYALWEDPPEIWNTLTASYQGGQTRFPPDPRGAFRIESLEGFDYVRIALAATKDAKRIETTFGLDDIWYAGNLGPVTIPEPATWILVAAGIGAILLGRKRRNSSQQ